MRERKRPRNSKYVLRNCVGVSQVYSLNNSHAYLSKKLILQTFSPAVSGSRGARQDTVGPMSKNVEYEGNIWKRYLRSRKEEMTRRRVQVLASKPCENMSEFACIRTCHVRTHMLQFLRGQKLLSVGCSHVRAESGSFVTVLLGCTASFPRQ